MDPISDQSRWGTSTPGAMMNAGLIRQQALDHLISILLPEIITDKRAAAWCNNGC